MKRLWAAILLGTLFLAACNGGDTEEEAATGEDATTEETTVEEVTEEPVEDVTTEEDTDDASAANPDSEDSSQTTDGSVDLAEGEIDEADFESSYGVDRSQADIIENAEETDLSPEDVLKDVSEINSYVHDTSIIIEMTQNGSVMAQDFQGIVAEVDESDGIIVASDYFDQNSEILGPYAYGNTDTGEVLVFENNEWVDFSSAYEVEELVYGIYSNMEQMVDDLSDFIEVLETDDYHLLYYTGNDDEVYEQFQNSFEVQFEGADMSQLELGFAGFVNKASGDLETINLLSRAPGIENPEEFLTMGILLNYSDYGAFDDSEIKTPTDSSAE